MTFQQKQNNLENKINTFPTDVKKPIESTTFPSVQEKISNPPKAEVSPHFTATLPLLPEEIVIQSSPIETVTSSTSQTPSKLKTIPSEAEQNVLALKTVPFKLFNAQNIQPHLFDGDGTQTSEKDLITFIQKLMNQAKKEQSMGNLHLNYHGLNQLTDLNNPKSTTTPTTTSQPDELAEKMVRSTPGTTTTTTTTTTTREPASTSTSSTSTAAVTLRTLPLRTTLRTTTTTAATTTEASPSGVITRLLGEAAAPIAGLSAATLAYSAAAMLPVWLPAALGRRRREMDTTDTAQLLLELLAEHNLK